MLLMVVGCVIAASIVYQRLEYSSLRDRAEATIAEATDLTRRLDRRLDAEQIRLEHHAAWEDLEAARTEFADARYRAALDRGERSRLALRKILNLDEGETSEIRFAEVQGGVEYRRGDHGTWQRARHHDVLNLGDWIKTASDGAAEIRFGDGSNFRLRPGTMMQLDVRRNVVTGHEEKITDIQWGWVDINTTRSESKVKTPKSEARVHRDSEAEIVIDRKRGAGRFRTFRGSAEIASASGQTREVGAREQVEQVGDRLSPPQPLPAQPRLIRPAADQQVALEDEELQLTWEPVRGATRYALNISRSPLFGQNLISDDNRRQTSARLGLQGEGIFYWQVAAIDRGGARGSWSETRAFRIAANGSAQGQETDDTIPPGINVDDIQVYGSLVIVNGSTEPGATVRINEEPVVVQFNGAFSKTIQMTQAGYAFLRIVATDAWDNSAEVKRRVFIDSF